MRAHRFRAAALSILCAVLASGSTGCAQKSPVGPKVSQRPANKSAVAAEGQADELSIEIQEEGDGPVAKDGQTVVVHYVGSFPDGTVFDSSRERGKPFEFKLGGGTVIKGWEEICSRVKVGSKVKAVVPANLAYGSRGQGSKIPPNATLHFEMEILDAR